MFPRYITKRKGSQHTTETRQTLVLDNIERLHVTLQRDCNHFHRAKRERRSLERKLAVRFAKFATMSVSGYYNSLDRICKKHCMQKLYSKYPYTHWRNKIQWLNRGKPQVNSMQIVCMLFHTLWWVSWSLAICSRTLLYSFAKSAEQEECGNVHVFHG